MAKKEALPDSLKALSDQELQSKIDALSKERTELKRELQKLTAERDAHVAKEKATASADQTNTLGERINTSLKKQLIEKGYQEKVE